VKNITGCEPPKSQKEGFERGYSGGESSGREKFLHSDTRGGRLVRKEMEERLIDVPKHRVGD